MHYFGPKSKNAISDGTPLTCKTNLIYMSAGKCRGPKSSNRIELSGFIQVYCIFTDLSLFSGEGTGGGGVLGAWEVPPYICIHMHAHTCGYAKIYLYRNCKWPSSWVLYLLACLACACACSCGFMWVHACIHTCMCAYGGTLHAPNTPYLLALSPELVAQMSKNAVKLE